MSRHKWDVVNFNKLRCCRCGLETTPSRAKRGVGKCSRSILLEDFEDLAIIAERKGEPAEPFEVVKKRLERKWEEESEVWGMG